VNVDSNFASFYSSFQLAQLIKNPSALVTMTVVNHHHCSVYQFLAFSGNPIASIKFSLPFTLWIMLHIVYEATNLISFLGYIVSVQGNSINFFGKSQEIISMNQWLKIYFHNLKKIQLRLIFMIVPLQKFLYFQQ
jgi:hypothetical protein